MAARVDAPVQCVTVDAQALTREHKAFQFSFLQVRHIHVQEYALRQAFVQHALRDLRAHVRRRGELQVDLVLFGGIQGKGDARGAPDDGLHRGSDRAGIGHIVADIGVGVDA